MYRALGLLGALLGAALAVPLPAPATGPAGEQATYFVAFEADVPESGWASLFCEYDDAVQGSYLMTDVSHDGERYFESSVEVHAIGPGQGVGARAVELAIDPAVPATPARYGIQGVGRAETGGGPTRVRVAAAAFNVAEAECWMNVDGVAVRPQPMPREHARILWADDFGGTANARLSPVGQAAFGAKAVEEVPGSLSMVIGDAAGFDHEPEFRVTEPDGTVTTGEAHRVGGGAAGTWTFEASGVFLVDSAPLLWIMQLPADWAAPDEL